MSPTRRDFLKLMTAIGAATAIPATTSTTSAAQVETIQPTAEPLPIDATDPLTISLFSYGGSSHIEASTIGYIGKNDEGGWWVRLSPPSCDTFRLKDRDDQRGVVWADSFDTPGEFLDAVMRAGFAPKPRLVRVALANDYHDWDKDEYRFKDHRYPWHAYPLAENDDEYIGLIGDRFEIVDTRRVIQERVPWANAVVQPSTFGYEHYQFYAHVEYS